MSGSIQKSQIPTRSQTGLPNQVKAEIIEAKDKLEKNIGLVVFENNRGNGPADGRPLPKVSQGCTYYEFDVGAAHPEVVNKKGGRARGIRRLVFEVHAGGMIMSIYYSEEHYGKASFVKITY